MCTNIILCQGQKQFSYVTRMHILFHNKALIIGKQLKHSASLTALKPSANAQFGMSECFAQKIIIAMIYQLA